MNIVCICIHRIYIHILYTSHTHAYTHTSPLPKWAHKVWVLFAVEVDRTMNTKSTFGLKKNLNTVSQNHLISTFFAFGEGEEGIRVYWIKSIYMKRNVWSTQSKLCNKEKKNIYIFTHQYFKTKTNIHSMNVILVRRSGKLIDKIVYYNYHLNMKKICVFSDLFLCS